jgi:hypothetical protein
MPTFTPPTDNFYNLSDFDMDTPMSPNNRIAYRLLRFYSPLPRGRNVYKLDTGTYTENEPADMGTVTVTYYGGHAYTVTDDEAASLTSAGYGAYLT